MISPELHSVLTLENPNSGKKADKAGWRREAPAFAGRPHVRRQGGGGGTQRARLTSFAGSSRLILFLYHLGILPQSSIKITDFSVHEILMEIGNSIFSHIPTPCFKTSSLSHSVLSSATVLCYPTLHFSLNTFSLALSMGSKMKVNRACFPCVIHQHYIIPYRKYFHCCYCNLPCTVWIFCVTQ